MNPSECLKTIMKVRDLSCPKLAAKMGKSTASAVSNTLRRENGMRIDTFLEMIEHMDCEMIIRSNLDDCSEWVVKREEKNDEGKEAD